MLDSNLAVYFGQENEANFTGFVAENDFFAVLTADEGLAKEKGKEFLHKLASEIDKQKINHLEELDEFIAQQLKEHNIPTGSSLACALIREKKCFLKTTGTGEVQLKRGKEIGRLIWGNKSASGFIEENDFFIFTISKFAKFIQEPQLKNIIDEREPAAVRELLTPIIKTQDDDGIIVLLIRFKGNQGGLEPTLKTNRFLDLITSLQTKRPEYGRKKILTTVGVGLIFTIFLWSVVSGYLRRSGAKIDQEIQSKKELIAANLNQAEEVAFINLPRANALIDEAKRNLQLLKKDVNGKRPKEIAEIEKLIKDKEAGIFKQEVRPADEFFDLTIESRDARGDRMSLDKDIALILDKNGAIYKLSLPKKSLGQVRATKIKNAYFVGQTQESTLFFTNEGVFKVEGVNVKKVIDRDSDWGKIVDLIVYNNTLYLLDSLKNQIYKYSPTDSGYSGKSSYLKPQEALNFKDANSMAIDSSVYIGFDNSLFKFTGGLRDGFATAYPDKNVKIDKITTNEELEKIYAWDKDEGVIYIMAKTGSYERQITSAILKKATDFVVFNKNAYILDGAKIYKINLD